MRRVHRVFPAAFLVLTLAACAAGQHIARGDELLGQKKYSEAIAAYEKALRVDPGNGSAEQGIKRARHDAVQLEIDTAQALLSSGDYPEALKHALRAQRMPIDLDEVGLVRDIDETIARATRQAEEQVAAWSERGLFIPATELAEQVVRASPGVESRRQWADEVRAKAASHFGDLAADLETQGLLGAATMQLAMASRVGGEAPPARVSALWDRFTEPVCFAAPTVVVKGTPKGAERASALLEQATRAALDGLRARCGDGTKPLGVRAELSEGEVIDDTKVSEAAKPLPGSGIETMETYYEERPYTVEEEVTDYEKHIEKQERRDCAPRPGKPRGCVTWTEDVEVTVPVKKMVTRTKVEKIKKTRPARGPFPPDSVVAYEVTTTTRKVALAGTLFIDGAASEGWPLRVSVVSEDSSNDEKRHPKALVRADPMNVKDMAVVLDEAAAALSEQVGKGLAEAVAAWSKADGEVARKRVLEGKLPEAEEIYLRLIALGAVDDTHLREFFRDRYGKSVGQVMDALLMAMGIEVERRRPGDDDKVGFFPKRGAAAAAAAGAADGGPETGPARRGTAAESGPSKKRDVSKMSAEELQALEQDSLDPQPSPKAPVPGAPTAP